MIQLKPEERVFVALDFDTEKNALEMVDQLKGRARSFKVGSELFTVAGQRIVNELVRRGHRVFLDLKFHDIPTTVARSVAVAVHLGVYMVNVHALGGAAMIRKAAETLKNEAARSGKEPPKLIAVTILTSFDETELGLIGLKGSIAKHVASLASLAQSSGADGVVASPHEIAIIRKKTGDNFLIVTPGVRPAWAVSHDQKRTATPSEAIRDGADFIVVGRPVTGAGNPAAAFDRIIEEIRESEDKERR